MKPHTATRAGYLLAAVIVAALFITACNPDGKHPCGPCPAIAAVIPNLSFRVVDKTSGKNLFFGSGAAYTPSQLTFNHIVNGNAVPVPLRIDTLGQFFNIAVFPGHRSDTVTMQISGRPQDILLFQTGFTEGCCRFLILNSVSFNGATVYTAQDGPKVAVLKE